MTALAAACFFVGYLLVYAAVANKGEFARTPWAALSAPDTPAGGAGA